MCKVLNVSRNAFYNWLHNYNKKIDNFISISTKILDIYWDSKGIYGSPRITAILNSLGIKITQKTVRKYMKILGIESIHTSKFPCRKSSMTQEEKLLINNFYKNLVLTRLNQVWTTDITYIHTKYDGTLYLISFIDQFSKKVVGWYLSKSQKTDVVIIAINLAIKNRKPLPGLIVHSDKGSQFRSKLYRKLLTENRFVYSYTELNHSCDQNAAQESFHASLKKEWLSTRILYYYEDAYKTIFKYIEGFYNPKRIYSSIGYISPIEFENRLK